MDMTPRPWMVLTLGAILLGAPLHAAPAQPAPSSAPAAAAAKTHPRDASVERMLKIGVPVSPVIGPGGEAFMRERYKGVFQLFRRPAGVAPGGAMDRLTNFTDGVGGFSLSPDGKTLLFTAARGGSEQTRVYRLDAATTQVVDETAPPLLAPGDGTPAARGGVQYAPGAWLRDSSGFFYRANDATPANFHLYRYDLASGTRTAVLQREGAWSANQASRDGTRLLVTRSLSASQSEVHELNLASGDLRDLTLRDEGGAPMSNSVLGYLPGESEVLILSDYQTNTDGLWIRNVQTGALRSANDTLARLGITSPELDGVTMSFEGDLLAISANDRGYTRLHVVSLPDFAPLELPALITQASGLIGVPQLRNRRLVVSISDAVTPGLSYSITFDERGRASAPQPQTVADDQGIDLSAFIAPALVEYESFDGLRIPAWVWMPEGRTIGDGRGPVPFVVDFHGGPEGQSRPGFAREYQILLSAGYGVMAPNVRGSTGYGRVFQMKDNYKQRWGSVKDGVAAARWLVQQTLAAPGKIAGRGGSYGGFMTSATLIEDTNQSLAQGTPPLFGCAIQSVGIVNFRTFLEQTADYRRKLREVEYGPLDDTEFLDSISPIRMLDKIRVPMMIVHGLNDPRVPVGEAMQLAIALQQRGFDPELLYYPDEGHGLAKTANRVLYMERTLKFLARTIGR